MSKGGKNIQKGKSYQYSFERMAYAIEKEFYLEAIMIPESIISDRLLSYLSGKIKGSNYINVELSKRTSFGRLIIIWSLIDSQVEWKEFDNLIIATDKFRKNRNKCAHSIAKSNPTKPTRTVNEFICLSKECADSGYIIARYICDWHKKELRKHLKK